MKRSLLHRRSISPLFTRKAPAIAGASIQRPERVSSERPGISFCASSVMNEVSVCGARLNSFSAKRDTAG